MNRSIVNFKSGFAGENYFVNEILKNLNRLAGLSNVLKNKPKSLMAVNLVPQKTFVLNYPLDSIKHSINETLRLQGFMLNAKNDVLNTYKIAIVIGFNTGIMDVSLSPIDDINTSCTFQIFNTTGGIASAAALSSLQDKFLETFTNILTGGKIKVVDAPANSAGSTLSPAAWFLILFLIALVFVIFIAKYT